MQRIKLVIDGSTTVNKYQECIFTLCEYYRVDIGADNMPFRVKATLEWIKQNVKEEHLIRFRDKVISTIDDRTLRNNTLPSIAELANIIKPSKEELAHKGASAFEYLCAHPDSYRTFITDQKRVIAGLDRLGGWKKFCLSDRSALPFLKKDFIESYVNCDTSLIELKVFRGIIENDKRPMYYGSEKGKYLLEQKTSTQIDKICSDIGIDTKCESQNNA